MYDSQAMPAWGYQPVKVQGNSSQGNILFAILILKCML